MGGRRRQEQSGGAGGADLRFCTAAQQRACGMYGMLPGKKLEMGQFVLYTQIQRTAVARFWPQAPAGQPADGGVAGTCHLLGLLLLLTSYSLNPPAPR